VRYWVPSDCILRGLCLALFDEEALMPSLLNMAEDAAYYRGLEIVRLQDIVTEKAAEIERLKVKLKKIAEHPDTPELIRQYAAGRLEGEAGA
jgi:hypothetical protein